VVKRIICWVVLAVLFSAIVGCDYQKTADDIQQTQQEKLLKEGSAQTGMPAIKNFRERKILKDILELRDQEGLTTYVYLFSEMSGKIIYLGEAIGYGIPYATQYTNPQKIDFRTYDESKGGEYRSGSMVIPQADPNGLYSPAAAEGTWILLKDPNGKGVKPVYVEPRIIVSPFKLNL
jgi:hypothetical protein